MTHDELARSLADHLVTPNRMVWTDIQLGPVGSPRPDVFTIQKSFVRPAPRAYEVKISISDFRADVTEGKWCTYLEYADSVCFAAPRGLLTRDMVPEHAGLILHGPKGWRMARKPVLKPGEIPSVALLKLLIDGVEREGPRYRAKTWNESRWMKDASTKFGALAAKAIANHQALEADTEYAKSEAQTIVRIATERAQSLMEEARLPKLRIELCAVLGLEHTSNEWQIQAALSRVRTDLKRHPALRQLEHIARMLGPLANQCETFCKDHNQMPEVA